jgi:hypothetical protein
MPSNKKTKKTSSKSGNLFDFIKQSNQDSIEELEKKENIERSGSIEGSNKEEKGEEKKEVNSEIQNKINQEKLETEDKIGTEKISITNLLESQPNLKNYLKKRQLKIIRKPRQNSQPRRTILSKRNKILKKLSSRI